MGDADGGHVPDDIRILSISPSPTIPLWVGDTVNFEVSIEYNLVSSGSKTLSMLIEECSCDPPAPQALQLTFPNAEPVHFQSRAFGTAEPGRRMQVLTRKIRVPVAQALNVSVKLGDESEPSGPIDTKVYRITDGGRPASGTQNSVQITSVRPPAGTLLRAGVDVEFEVAVDYNLPAETAILGLQIETAGHSALQISEPVKKGQRRIVFREPVHIPDAASISIFTVTAHLGKDEARETAEYKIAGH
jgi:hypothetical protein